MKVYAISDLHLSTNCDKPMDIFGDAWKDYWNKIVIDWKQKVTEDDLVLIAGDISWATDLSDAMYDINKISELPGKKVLLRGNHDYWWPSNLKLKAVLPKNFYFIKNDCIRFDNILICGSRLWSIGENVDSEDKKLADREALRLRLSLEDMDKKRKDDDFVLCMTHFPPFDFAGKDLRYVSLIEEFKINKVIYGHLHGKECRVPLLKNINGIDYYLTSCDQIDFKLVEIL